ncbi:hypothetical protein [Herpetosiphon giganteus]|uniref:hypothetical protein n=1 Tax=Herpetosiphon giganteus TaxID=2029754 RepID=UPI00195EF513|nr:hypothetical protein [Herpetosiphon giganteus]MBM7843781.1 hypothetical protein [Herpetosiphon giganteus]
MAKRDPNEFTQPTVKKLAERAGYICSNPRCKAHTVGPHAEDVRAVITGEGAHIRGGKPKSARYNSSMTPAERSTITNGIWLCGRCASLIDKDERTYTVEVLYSWKKADEQEISNKISGVFYENEAKMINLRKLEDKSGLSEDVLSID